MSTIKATNIAHTSASVSNMVLGSNGAVTFGGSVVGSGLDLITTQSFSAASTVSVNNCFTSTYENYRIMFYADGSASDQGVNLRLRASGIDASGANYNSQSVAANSTTVGGGRTTSDTNIRAAAVASNQISSSIFEIFRPNLSLKTAFQFFINQSYLDAYISIVFGNHTLSTAYDGFSLIPGTGTITGTLRVYGYKN